MLLSNISLAAISDFDKPFLDIFPHLALFSNLDDEIPLREKKL